MSASIEALQVQKRDNPLRETDRQRAALGGAVRHAIDEVQDAESHDVETAAPKGERLIDQRSPIMQMAGNVFEKARDFRMPSARCQVS